MGHFRVWLRWKQSRGHGIHSPFAFDLITHVISAPHDYYAFQNILRALEANDLTGYAQPDFNRLSFRLVNHFKTKRILEINSGLGVNTCYLTSSASDILCTCVEKEESSVAAAKKLLKDTARRCEFVATLPPAGSEPCDAIFINLKVRDTIQNLSVETLHHLSHENTYWVIYPINSRQNKQFWSAIVKDERVSITFDRKKTGIAFLRPSFHKMHYFV